MASGRVAASINQTLTAYAAGLSQDTRSAMADFFAPQCPVGVSMGQYKSYDVKNAFQIYATARAIGGSANRIKFDADDETYNCKPQALEITIDDAERDAAGDDQSILEQSRARTLVVSANIAHEKDVIDAVDAALTAVAGKGNWSSPNVDPVAELDEQIEALATITGMMPNALALGLAAWRIAKNHPKVIAKFPGAAVVGVSFSQFASLLLNPNIEVRVGVLARDTTKFGRTASKTQIVGSNAYVFCRSATPTQYDPSLAKVFMTRAGSVDAVRVYRDENARSDVLAVDWSRDIKVTSSACGRKLAIT